MVSLIGYLFVGLFVLMLVGVVPTKPPWQPWQYVAGFAVGYALVWMASTVIGRKAGDSDAP